MARLDSAAERPLSLRKGSSKDFSADGGAGAAGDSEDEKRAAAPVDDDDDEECAADGEHCLRTALYL